ncbi:MAG: hypothetical protein QM680_13135, partial [Luteolibacter sp.]
NKTPEPTASRGGSAQTFCQETKPITMNAIRPIIILLRNTVLVTLAVVVGFLVGSAIGLPNWLQVVCILPAGYLFLRLSGDPIPSSKHWIPHALAITILVAIMSLVTGLVRTRFPALYESSWTFIMIFFIMSMPMRALAALFERHWPIKDDGTSPEAKTP